MKSFIKMIFASCLGVVLASVVCMFIFFSMMGYFIAKVANEIKAPTQTEKTASVNEGDGILVLNMKGVINDGSNSTFIDELMHKDGDNYSLYEITKAIDNAATNDNVKAISLRLSNASFGYATAQEIRDHLLKFKESGKKIYAFSNVYGRGNYFLSSVADSIYVNPYGMVEITGLASTTQFYTGPLKKLGIEMQVFKVGTYKGAVEPFILNKLSEANKMQIQIMLDGLWKNTADQIATSRKVSADLLQHIANEEGVFMPIDSLVKDHLVDSVVYQTDYRTVLAHKILGNDNVQGLNLLSVGDLQQSNNSSDVHIAVVYAEGEIINTSDDDNPFSLTKNKLTINRGILKELNTLKDDQDVAAIVLRVNSPGGDAFLSEEICHLIKQIKEKKPIVASMGNYAASGGYYISSNASRIIAEPTTITGSIGIFGMFPNFAGTAQKIDLTYDTVKTAELADFGNPLRPMTDKEKSVLQGMINRGYNTFITRVAEGRGMTTAKVDSIGQGRVWLGQKAMELGLVDEMGGLDKAISIAAQLAKVTDYTVTFKKKESIWDKLLSDSSSSIKEQVMGIFSTPEQRLLTRTIRKVKSYTGVMARPPYSVETITMDPQTEK